MSASVATEGQSFTRRNQIITVHRSFLFRNVTIGQVQTIVTHNLAVGLSVKELTAAVHRLVDRNPVLSGTMFFGTGSNKGIFVETGKFDTFVHILETPRGIPSPKSALGHTRQVNEYVHQYMEPLLPPAQKGIDELKQKAPLFGIHVMLLPNNYVYYAPRLSHAIGDGQTYFMILQELNAILNKKPLPPPIVWESEAAVNFDFTHQFSDPTFLIAMTAMFIIYALFGFPKTQMILLSTDKINKKKKELASASDSTSFLSTNDVITAAICEGVSKHYSLTNQSVCFRNGRWPGVGNRDAGNVTKLVPLDTKLGRNPQQVRKLVQAIPSDPNRPINFWSVVSGRMYIQTNWACIQQTLEGTVYHTPVLSCIKEVDWPVAIICRPNPNEIVVAHKLKNVDPSVGLLSQLVADETTTK